MPAITFIIFDEESNVSKKMSVNAKTGENILDCALENGIFIEHACEKSCACCTCHVYIKQGIESIDPASEEEEDMLDKAWGVENNSRLSCQAIIADKPLEVEIPKYTINSVSEKQI